MGGKEMSIEWLKQYLLWGLFFFAIAVILAIVYVGIKYIIRKVNRRKSEPMNKDDIKDFAICAIVTAIGLTITICLWCCLL